MQLSGGTDSAAFAAYIEHILGPTLRPGQIVLVDKESAHTAPQIAELVAARGCRLWFLPAVLARLVANRTGDRKSQERVARNAATGALTERRTSIAPRQVQVAAEFVHYHEIVCVLVGDLDLKGGASPGVAQKGAQTLFFRDQRSRAIARLMVQRESEVPCSCAQVLTCSGKVASGEALS